MSSDASPDMHRITSVPLVQNIIKNHAINIRKQEKTQLFSKLMLETTQNKKKQYTEHEARSQQVRQQLLLRKKVKTIQKLKKKSEEDFRKILQKLHQIDQKKQKERQQTMAERERKIFRSSHNREEAEKCLKAKIHNRLADSTLTHFQDNYIKTFHKSMGESMQMMSGLNEKQSKAEQNRKSLMMSSSIHEVNQKKHDRSLKARQKFEEEAERKLTNFMSKFVSFIDREDSIHNALIKRCETKKKNTNQKIDRIHNAKENIQNGLLQKLMQIQQKISEKNRRSNQNKQNMNVQRLHNKKLKRIEREEKNLNKFEQGHKEFQDKMLTMYQKEKQHWNFLTTVASFQSELIERNIYQSNKVAHRSQDN